MTSTRFASPLLLLPIWAIPALLPVGRTAETGILAMIILLGVFVWRRQVPGPTLWPRWIPLLLLAFCLPPLLSMLDAAVPDESLRSALSTLRFAPLAVYVWLIVREPGQSARLEHWMALLVLFWCIDASVQALSGWSLGGHWEADRLSGIFGADNLKFGPVLVLFSPFLLRWSETRWPGWARHALMLLIAILVLLAGTRSAWLSAGLVSAVFLWRWHSRGSLRRGARMLAASGALVAAIALALYPISEDYRARIDRSLAAVQGETAQLDFALAGRLPIWKTAIAMSVDRPLTGVGVRGFRHVYADYADADDPWLGFDGERGAFHAHQIILELVSETGIVGLVCWLAAALWLIVCWHRSSATAREQALPAALALAVMVFPLNTHYAFYSSFWSLCLWWLLAVTCAQLMPTLVRPAQEVDGNA